LEAVTYEYEEESDHQSLPCLDPELIQLEEQIASIPEYGKSIYPKVFVDSP